MVIYLVIYYHKKKGIWDFSTNFYCRLCLHVPKTYTMQHYQANTFSEKFTFVLTEFSACDSGLLSYKYKDEHQITSAMENDPQISFYLCSQGQYLVPWLGLLIQTVTPNSLRWNLVKSDTLVVHKPILLPKACGLLGIKQSDLGKATWTKAQLLDLFLLQKENLWQPVFMKCLRQKKMFQDGAAVCGEWGVGRPYPRPAHIRG